MSAPRAFSRLGSRSAAVNEETTVIRRRARVIATLRRRSPPSMLSGPKRWSTRPCGRLAVADREDDRVALVALHALEVLDEEPLVRGVVEERRRAPARGQARRTRLLDPVGVRDAERDDAERLRSGGVRACSSTSSTTRSTSAAVDSIASPPARAGAGRRPTSQATAPSPSPVPGKVVRRPS